MTATAHIDLWPRRCVLATALAAVVFTAAVTWLSLQRHAQLESAEDLAMFEQMLWSVRQGHGLVTSLSGNGYLQFPHHFFGEHVSPILYLLAWPAGLTHGPEALLFIQALLLALAAFPLGRLAAELARSPRLGLAAALGWLVQPALAGAALYDFHMEAFEGWFLFAFALALYRDQRRAWLWAILYAACKEDTPLYLAAAALLLGWKFRRWRLALPVAGAALLYALAAILWIGPAFSPTGRHLMVGRMLTPQSCGGLWAWTRAVLLHGDRWLAFISHLLAMGLLPALGGRLLIPLGMAVGVMWISRGEAQALLYIHYPLTVYPLLALAAVFGLARLSAFARAEGQPAARRLLVPAAGLLTVLGLAWTGQGQADTLRSVSASRTGGGLAAGRALDATLAGLPADQELHVLPTLAAHVARRQKLKLWDGLYDADWLVLRLDGQGYPFKPIAYQQWLDERLRDDSPYGVVALVGEQVAVLRRGYARNLNRAARHTARYLEAEYLHHRIGRPVFDLAAHNGYAWEAGRQDRRDFALFGSYLSLAPGRYRAGFRVKADRLDATKSVTLDITEQHGRIVLGKIVLDRPTPGYVWLETEIAVSGGDDLEFRCWKPSYGRIRLDAVRWRRLD